MIDIARLTAEIGHAAKRDQAHDDALWRSGYAAGYLAGREVGYGAAHHEMALAWTEVHRQARALASRRTTAERAELLRRDTAGAPCPARCGRCSVCIRAESVARRGGDYMGKGEVADRAA